jgi:nitroreductase
MEVIEAIKTRHSIRKYKQTSVDDKTLDSILEAARWAPSWANTQCCRFVVVRDSRIKAALADALVMKGPASESLATAPVAIVACAEMGKSGFYKNIEGPATDKGDSWYMYDVALAMANLTLAAVSVGLGTVHLGLFDAKKAAAAVQLPPGYCVVAMTPLGYPDGEPRITTRKELSEIVSYDKFGGKK